MIDQPLVNNIPEGEPPITGNDEQILANAPEGATHFDYTYISQDAYFKQSGKRVGVSETQLEENTRALSDIQTIADLRRENAELEQFKKNALLRLKSSTELIDEQVDKIAGLGEREGLLKKLLYCCDGLSTEYAQNNHGEVKEWLRHVDTAYQALKESK